MAPGERCCSFRLSGVPFRRDKRGTEKGVLCLGVTDNDVRCGRRRASVFCTDHENQYPYLTDELKQALTDLASGSDAYTASVWDGQYLVVKEFFFTLKETERMADLVQATEAGTKAVLKARHERRAGTEDATKRLGGTCWFAFFPALEILTIVSAAVRALLLSSPGVGAFDPVQALTDTFSGTLMLTNGEEEKTPLTLCHTSRRTSTSSGRRKCPASRSLSRGRDETVQLKAQLAAAHVEISNLSREISSLKAQVEVFKTNFDADLDDFDLE